MTLLEAPDVYIAAVALSETTFYEGKGDRSYFFKAVLEQNPTKIPDLGRKLKLVTDKTFMGLNLYNDKLCNPDKVNRNMIYKLWLHCCRRSSAVLLETLIAFQPHAEEVIRNYDRFVDENGRTTLNQEEHTEFRKLMKEKAELKKKQKEAEKSQKMRMNQKKTNKNKKKKK